MCIKGIDHIAINVIDMEKSVDFYELVLQLKKLTSVDMGDHLLQYFSLENGTRLELIQYKSAGEHVKNMLASTEGIYRHMAVVTDNINAVFESAESYHIPIRAPISLNKKLGVYNFLMEDPNGVEIEIVQPCI